MIRTFKMHGFKADWVVIAICVLWTLFSGGGDLRADDQPGLVSHRALYEASLPAGSSDGLIADITGTVAMSFERTCEGWIATQDFRARYGAAEGVISEHNSLFTSWESLDGQDYRFAFRSTTDGATTLFRGRASLVRGLAEYQLPEPAQVDLPQDTLFPIAHHIWLMGEIRAGKRVQSRPVFSGSDDIDPLLVASFVGNKRSMDRENAGNLPNSPLLTPVGWPVTLSYHDPADQAGSPLFEVHMFLLENGISPRIVLSWGDLSTQLMLKAITGLPAVECP